ncbi:lipoate--protein ligase family protein [Marinilactibacillus sp. Marseille-P9653]|uniref:lipoate--protein ligase family protein n=1 Tax=Marinilactibacillus sp. Marseille-P9653 TaxID=2866583 RepID=UPI001CE49150|nr:lipoate--protein ligase family protein [Marinilactibacillus sp. Marseille-P9653]
MTPLTELSIPDEKPYLLFDSESSPFERTPASPFALTDAFIDYAVRLEQPVLHFWSTKPLVILGMMDTKLPYLDTALTVLKEAKYDFVVRNSGGLAVVSDPGILNISLIFPEGDERLTITEGYQRMHHLIEQTFKSYGKSIDAIEIPDSYCPGDYDLSIDGKKIAGISQRRIKGGIAIMIYISVTGDQNARGNLIRTFYEKGLSGTKTKWTFPNVRPSSMTTLEEVFGIPFSLVQVKQSITMTIQKLTTQLSLGQYDKDLEKNYLEGMEKMKKRNEKVL